MALYGEMPEVTVDGQKYNGILVRIARPLKTAVLRFPKPDELLERLKKNKTIRHNLSARSSKTEVQQNTEADKALFDKLRLDKGLDFDEYEASSAISRLVYCEAIKCERAGDFYKVTLKTMFGDTVHTVNVPMERDLFFYRRAVIDSTDLPHGKEELRFRTEPAVTLYDSVFESTEGYALDATKDSVPPNHKSAVVVELIQAYDEADRMIDPN